MKINEIGLHISTRINLSIIHGAKNASCRQKSYSLNIYKCKTCKVNNALYFFWNTHVKFQETWSVPFLIQDSGCLWRRGCFYWTREDRAFSCMGNFFSALECIHRVSLIYDVIMFYIFFLKDSGKTSNIKFQRCEKCRLSAEPAARHLEESRRGSIHAATDSGEAR